MGISPGELRQVTERIVDRGAPAYLMAVAGNADPMLGYLTTSFRDHPRLRNRTRRRMASAMQQRLEALGVSNDERHSGEGVARLYASHARASGDRRPSSTLEQEARRLLMVLRERGFDLGIADESDADARLERIYLHARRALYSTLEDGVIRDACLRSLRARTAAGNRDDYLAHPPLGERLRVDDARLVGSMYPGRTPQVQLVISDGLNADAINEQLRTLLPMLRRLLTENACHLGEIDIVVQ